LADVSDGSYSKGSHHVFGGAEPEAGGDGMAGHHDCEKQGSGHIG